MSGTSPDRSTDFRRSYPLDVHLYGRDGPVLYIDTRARQTLHLELRNSAPRPIEVPAADEPQFELHLRPDTLAKDVTPAVEPADEWHVDAPRQEKDIIVVPITRRTLLSLEPDERTTLTLRDLSAGGSGTRTDRVALYYHGLVYAGDDAPLDGTRTTYLHVTDHRGQQHIPMHVGFLGSNTVLNDGVALNELTLRIANTNPDAPLSFSVDADDVTRFTLFFDVQNTEEQREWALGTKSQVAAIEVTTDAEGWQVDKDTESETPTWTLTPPAGYTLDAREHVTVSITGIITSAPTGPTNLYLRYENIPGHWDGYVVGTIQKGPLVVRQHKLGIRREPANEALEVKGRIKDQTGYVMPQGGIIMWSGQAADIPEGWVLCDGQNGTPDLRDRFIVGASAETAGHSGGPSAHAHWNDAPPQIFTTDGSGDHVHGMPWPWYNNHADSGDDVTIIDRNAQNVQAHVTKNAGTHQHQITINLLGFASEYQTEEIRPRWYALCFIMKL